MSSNTGHARSVTSITMPSAPCIVMKGSRMSSWIDTEPKKVVKLRKKRTYPERVHQQALVKWLRLRQVAFCAIPNEGKRSNMQGAVMKSMGLTAGVSDLFIAEPRQGSAGFWVELKAPGNIPSDSQYEWLFKMRNKGYKAEWYDHWEKARLAIEEYIKLPRYAD